ncbi:uncharacterized protein GGS25DRAFT_534810 [Hypoxylon fragiforme]|uniref:uncharacterized protein n=1 Tax=Hypoxylon fragiforme TaxID=63214 RepID=UPI0020C721F5|nr:uncharacterized protein GGS25DRAFT_534810 [Hypoxylon fragiforme]KAI2604395.1 hypothetical protein GGS25DRAFT_534810 [Hypoxylon fragiforme]
MDKLSLETIIHIVGYLPNADLKSTRLTARVFRVICIPYLRTRAYASVHEKDFAVLNSISEHPIMRLSVREIVYPGIHFREDSVPAGTGQRGSRAAAVQLRHPVVSSITLLPLWPHYGFVTTCEAISDAGVRVESFDVDYAKWDLGPGTCRTEACPVEEAEASDNEDEDMVDIDDEANMDTDTDSDTSMADDSDNEADDAGRDFEYRQLGNCRYWWASGAPEVANADAGNPDAANSN